MLSKWLKEHFACDEVFIYAFNVHLSYNSFNWVLRPLTVSQVPRRWPGNRGNGTMEESILSSALRYITRHRLLQKLGSNNSASLIASPTRCYCDLLLEALATVPSRSCGKPRKGAFPLHQVSQPMAFDLAGDPINDTELNSKCHSIWRPITEPDQDSPLALCDFRTVRKEDLVPADVIFPHYCDEGYELYYSPAHRWFYKRGMSTNEVILFKLDDSSESEAKCRFLHLSTNTLGRFHSDSANLAVCPHSAFYDPTVPPNGPKRASIEVRAIVIDHCA